jgi:DNA-binding NarL/FixJ family response regulator
MDEAPTGARGGPRLTCRQAQILGLLATGLTAEAISRRLGISRRTVTKHQELLYRRLGTSDRLTTVLRAQLLGLVEPPIQVGWAVGPDQVRRGPGGGTAD